MMEILKERMRKEEITNITTICKRWEDIDPNSRSFRDVMMW